MTRKYSAALATEFAKSITSVGYLVHIGFASPQRWSDIGQVTFNSLTWYERDFTISGLKFDADAPLAATLSIPNLSKAGETQASDLFLGSDKLYDTLVTVYQFERDALGAGDALGPDVPKIALLAISGADITPEVVALSLVESKADSSWCPRRRVCVADGFRFAIPPGTTIVWDGKVLTLEEANG